MLEFPSITPAQSYPADADLPIWTFGLPARQSQSRVPAADQALIGICGYVWKFGEVKNYSSFIKISGDSKKRGVQ